MMKRAREGDAYEEGVVLGEGTYGSVVSARCEHGEVALKRIKGKLPNLTSTTLREIAILRSIDHPNIIRLFSVIQIDDFHTTLVLERCGCTLESHIKRGLHAGQTRRLFGQLVAAVDHLHRAAVYHRDIKPQNILIDQDSGLLKLADFGLAREVRSSRRHYTPEVITLWYRPPELLLGVDFYDDRVDMWSCGCVLGEMASALPVFAGDSEIGQLMLIFKTLGTPASDAFPAAKHWSLDFPQWWPRCKRIHGLCREGHELLHLLLMYNPAERCTARTALKHAYVVG